MLTMIGQGDEGNWQMNRKILLLMVGKGLAPERVDVAPLGLAPKAIRMAEEKYCPCGQC